MTDMNMGTEKEETYPATVATVIGPYKLVINKGMLDGIKVGQRFLIYSLSEEEVKDPLTGKSLGYLEIVKGRGKVVHLQDRMSTIESDETEAGERKIIRRNQGSIMFGPTEVEEIVTPSGRLVPFVDARVGDRAKPI